MGDALLEEVREIQKGITEILVAIGKMETEIKQLNSMSEKVDNMHTCVIKLERDLQTAFIRIDELKQQIDGVEDKMDNEQKAAKDDKKWLFGFVTSLIAITFAALELMKGK